MKIDIEERYQKYLKQIKLTEAGMHPEQKKQLRQTFFAAWGIAIISMRDEVGAIENEDEAIECMQDQLNQVGNHFLNLTNSFN